MDYICLLPSVLDKTDVFGIRTYPKVKGLDSKVF